MKISASKRQLARIIRENGGWRDGAKFASQDQEHCGKQKVISFYINEKPWFRGGTFWRGNGVHGDRIETVELVRGWHQTLLSRDEYFHLYPAQDADGWIEWSGGECPVAGLSVVDVKYFDVEGFVTGIALDFVWGPKTNIVYYRKTGGESAATNKGSTETDKTQTIEQLAAEYRNRKDYAERKQEEADSAKADADARLAKLVAAGKELGFVLSVAAPETELVITDWRDLQVGDVVWIEKKNSQLPSGEYEIQNLADGDEVQPFMIRCNGKTWWPNIENREWRFIRRP